MSDFLVQDLKELLSSADFLRLVENFGGIRLYIPARAKPWTESGISAAAKRALIGRYAGSYLKVPLARNERARHYRSHGLTNAQIARKLGITESGVERLFRRMPDRPAKGQRDERQGDLFFS